MPQRGPVHSGGWVNNQVAQGAHSFVHHSFPELACASAPCGVILAMRCQLQPVLAPGASRRVRDLVYVLRTHPAVGAGLYFSTTLCTPPNSTTKLHERPTGSGPGDHNYLVAASLADEVRGQQEARFQTSGAIRVTSAKPLALARPVSTSVKGHGSQHPPWAEFQELEF